MPVAPWALAILALSAVGFLNALYFVLATYRAIPPDPRWLPRVCRMDEGTCARVVDMPYARVFGLPNAAYGLAYYGVMAGGAAWAWVAGAWPWCAAFVAVAAGVVGFSFYLAWALVFRLRTVCVLCFLGHAINLLLLAGLVGACLSA